jgi:uncharacterized protein (TIGR04222 family)
MNQPWGLSGPQFLWIYGAGMAAFFAAPVLVALLARTHRAASSQVPVPGLDPYEAGYLAGGAKRAAEVVIGELASSAALRADSTGRISRADPARLAKWSARCRHGIAAGDLPDGLRAQKVRQRLAKDPGVVAIGMRLRSGRLLIARSWGIAAQVTISALWLALIIAGDLRLAEGTRNHRPTQVLGILFAFTILLGFASFGRLKRLTLVPTGAGAGYLEQLPGMTGAGGEAALFGIALAGLAAVPDPALRAALLAGLPSSGAGSGGCGGGGGGGCGGGGCGG